MPRGKKTSEEKREQVKAVIYLNPEASNRDIAKQTGLHHMTVQDIKKECKEELNSDDYIQYRANKKREFIDNAFSVVEKALELANKRFSKALDDEDAIDQLIDAVQDHELTQVEKKTLVSRLNGLQMNNIRDIAVALGTIYDKQALASGEPTQISESRKPLPQLIADLETETAKLKQMVSG